MVVGALGALILASGLAACSDDDGGGGGGTTAELCATVGEGQSLASGIFKDFDPTDTDRALEQLRSARVRLGELYDVAPGEVRGALSTEIDYIQALIDGLNAIPADDPSAAVAVVNGLDDQRAAVELASAELATFEAEKCGTPVVP